MITVLLSAGVLIAATTVVHLELLHLVAALRARWSPPVRIEMLAVIFATFTAHLIDIVLYAAVFAWMDMHPSFGRLAGHFDGSWSDYFYFSATSYTTLGFGDVYPLGELRVLAGIESLNGLVLIAWSASYTFAALQNVWFRNQLR